MKNLILIVLAATSFVSCAFRETDTINKQESENNLKLEKVYSDIRGEYQGRIVGGATTQEVTIQIYTLTEKDGLNSDGTNKFRLVPKAYIKRTNPLGASQVMDVRYIPESGQVTFIVEQNQKPGVDDIHTINATVTGQILKGEVLKPTGPYGLIEASLVSREASTPKNGSEKEEIARNLLAEYEKISGEYQGTLNNSKVDNGLSYPIQVRLFVVKEVVNGNIFPVLKGFFKRLDDDAQLFDLALNVAYDPTVIPSTITMSGKGEGRFFISMDGVVTGGKVLVNFSTHRGYAGQVELSKTK